MQQEHIVQPADNDVPIGLEHQHTQQQFDQASSPNISTSTDLLEQ